MGPDTAAVPLSWSGLRHVRYHSIFLVVALTEVFASTVYRRMALFPLCMSIELVFCLCSRINITWIEG